MIPAVVCLSKMTLGLQKQRLIWACWQRGSKSSWGQGSHLIAVRQKPPEWMGLSTHRKARDILHIKM